MKQLVTKAIILSRTDFGEADRIITVLTPNYGKLRLMAKGVRKNKSKLAGGIELFSTSDIGFLTGKRELGTLTSSRLDKHYGNIVKDIGRVQLGYDLIKLLNRVTEESTDREYYNLLEQTFVYLDDSNVNIDIIRPWFKSRLLKFGGHAPNLKLNANGADLELSLKYNFDLDSMSFNPSTKGRFSPNDIKLLRLMFSDHSLNTISRIKGIGESLDKAGRLIQAMQSHYIRD
jgi:DNA repair protein RecO (recombination protein O)